MLLAAPALAATPCRQRSRAARPTWPPLSLSLPLLLALAGCASQPAAPVPERPPAPSSVLAPSAPAAATAPPAPNAAKGGTARKAGGYYQDDGPGDSPPPNLRGVANASPRWESLHKFANRPYSVFGRDYVPMTRLTLFREQGVASWYGRKFHGQNTSSGEAYDMYAMTAAHPTLPIPSYARVTNAASRESVVVRINDRGPFHAGRVIDLSYTAAAKLGMVANGSALVEVESIVPDDAPPAAMNARYEADDAIALIARRSATADAAPRAVLPEIRDARGYFLQLGAFGNRDNAENLRARLARELPDLAGKLLVHPGPGIYRLHLGPWADHAEAQRIADRLRAAFELAPMMVQQR